MGMPKALLSWAGQPLVCYQVNQLREAGVDEVIVVLGHRSDDVYREVRRVDCRVMNNAKYFAGRSGSLRIGARAVSRDAEAIVIMSVDQPRPAALIRELVAAHDQRFAATRPSFEGHSGHPIVVSGWLRPELLEADEANEGLRGIIRAHASEIQSVAGDAACVLDLNTPEEYREALAALRMAG